MIRALISFTALALALGSTAQARWAFVTQDVAPRALAGLERQIDAESADADALLAPLSQQVEALERLAVAKALEVTQGNKVAAAKLLGVSRAKLYLRLP